MKLKTVTVVLTYPLQSCLCVRWESLSCSGVVSVNPDHVDRYISYIKELYFFSDCVLMKILAQIIIKMYVLTQFPC